MEEADGEVTPAGWDDGPQWAGGAVAPGGAVSSEAAMVSLMLPPLDIPVLASPHGPSPERPMTAGGPSSPRRGARHGVTNAEAVRVQAHERGRQARRQAGAAVAATSA